MKPPEAGPLRYGQIDIIAGSRPPLRLTRCCHHLDHPRCVDGFDGSDSLFSAVQDLKRSAGCNLWCAGRDPQRGGASVTHPVQRSYTYVPATFRIIVYRHGARSRRRGRRHPFHTYLSSCWPVSCIAAYSCYDAGRGGNLRSLETLSAPSTIICQLGSTTNIQVIPPLYTS